VTTDDVAVDESESSDTGSQFLAKLICYTNKSGKLVGHIHVPDAILQTMGFTEQDRVLIEMNSDDPDKFTVSKFSLVPAINTIKKHVKIKTKEITKSETKPKKPKTPPPKPQEQSKKPVPEPPTSAEETVEIVVTDSKGSTVVNDGPQVPDSGPVIETPTTVEIETEIIDDDSDEESDDTDDHELTLEELEDIDKQNQAKIEEKKKDEKLESDKNKHNLDM
jgi:hypothetical protein